MKKVTPSQTELVDSLGQTLFSCQEGVDLAHEVVGRIGDLKPADIQRALNFINENQEGNTHSTLRFTILGDPPISKRPRSSRIRNKEGSVVGIRVHAADAGEQESLRDSIARQLPSGHEPFGGEVELLLEIYRPMLASWPPYKRLLAELGYIRPESKPDFDNYAKIIVDAMRNVVFVDDGQVVNATMALAYSTRSRLEITASARKRRMNK